MKIGLFNTKGFNETEHFIKEEYDEMKRRGIDVELYWVRGRKPTRNEADSLDFAIYHFLPTAFVFKDFVNKPFCILPTANDIFTNNNWKILKRLEMDENCKFIGYQSFFHKRKYEEWKLEKPTVYIPHCVRSDLFKRSSPLNWSGGGGKEPKIIAGGRLVPKKGLHQLSSVDNLTIFGDGPLREKLKLLLPNAKFVGMLDGKQLKQLIEESWLLLCPYVIMPNGDQEGLPNIIKEALLMRLQVIASPIGAVEEFENISILSDWSKDSLLNAIGNIPREENKKGEKEVRNIFTPKLCVDRILKSIEEYA